MSKQRLSSAIYSSCMLIVAKYSNFCWWIFETHIHIYVGYTSAFCWWTSHIFCYLKPPWQYPALVPELQCLTSIFSMAAGPLRPPTSTDAGWLGAPHGGHRQHLVMPIRSDLDSPTSVFTFEDRTLKTTCRWHGAGLGAGYGVRWSNPISLFIAETRGFL